MAPSFVVASAAPFVFGVAPINALVVTVLHAMFILMALQSAKHRAELVESVSKQAAARSRVETANIQKSQFIANVSHELRTPLNAIIGYSEMLKESTRENGSAEDQGDVDSLLAASRRLLGMVNGLLDISKIEAGKVSLNIGWFDPAEMLAVAVETVRPMAEANGNALLLELFPALGKGVSDEFRLSQCVLNLLSNAAKFTKGGLITLRAKREAVDGVDCYVIEVIDTGIGMALESMQDLFEPFMQADASVARKYEGVGLGLAITRRIARLLGGDVTVARMPDAGSIFTLRTPVIARVAMEVDDSNGGDSKDGARATGSRAA